MKSELRHVKRYLLLKWSKHKRACIFTKCSSFNVVIDFHFVALLVLIKAFNLNEANEPWLDTFYFSELVDIGKFKYQVIIVQSNRHYEWPV